MSEIAAAAQSGDAERIGELLQSDAALVNAPGADGWTPRAPTSRC